MNKKGFTVVELIVSFSLTMLIVALLFQMLLGLKDLYISSGFKSQLLNKQALMSANINNDFKNKKITSIVTCDTNCLDITFFDGSTKQLFIDDKNNIFTYGDYSTKLVDGSKFGFIVIQNNKVEGVANDSKYNSFFELKIPIYHSLLKDNFGIHIVYQYDENDTIIAYQTPEECFGSPVSNGIQSYRCFEGNTFGLPTITDVVIPRTLNGVNIVRINNNSFQSKGLTSIFLHDGITNIGSNAFYANALTSFTIPDSVTSIGDWAFYANALTSITIPDSITNIGIRVFSNNPITSVTIPDSVISIGGSAFSANDLTSVTIPNSVTSIGSGAFQYNDLTNVVIPNSVTNIGDYAFYSNNLTNVTISNNATSIGVAAFSFNDLTSVTIPNSVTSIGSGAFQYNAITIITIDSNVTIASDTSMGSYGASFRALYTSNGQLAGFYTYSGGTWTLN